MYCFFSYFQEKLNLKRYSKDNDIDTKRKSLVVCGLELTVSLSEGFTTSEICDIQVVMEVERGRSFYI